MYQGAFHLANNLLNPCSSRLVPVREVGGGFLDGFIRAGILHQVNTALGGRPCG